MCISSDPAVIISYHESVFLQLQFSDRLAKTGICVHLIKSNFVVLKQQFGLKMKSQGSCVSLLFMFTAVEALHKMDGERQKPQG